VKELTSLERVTRFLRREPVDRIPTEERFWAETLAKWRAEGRLGAEESPSDHFGLDIRTCWTFNLVADLDFKDEIVEQTDETKLVRNGNGAVLRWWKNKTATCEHVDFAVKDRETWEKKVRPFLTDASVDRRRINFEAYRLARKSAAERKVFFTWGGVNVFECMHPVSGHEHMLVGMALDPDWVKDMVAVYAELLVRLMEILFAEEGAPDGVWFFEDMGFKERPFMSPQMYKEIVWPGHKRTFDYVHSLGRPVIVHSCGYVEPLVPGLIEAGLDCLQAMEVKAGMDLVKLKKRFGDRLSLMGGMDVRTMVANDRRLIQAELDRKLPAAMAGGGYCLHSDHSIPSEVEYDTYKFFLDRGREMGTYR
jgi:uroporphyrinogen decarboxylase